MCYSLQFVYRLLYCLAIVSNLLKQYPTKTIIDMKDRNCITDGAPIYSRNKQTTYPHAAIPANMPISATTKQILSIVFSQLHKIITYSNNIIFLYFVIVNLWASYADRCRLTICDDCLKYNDCCKMNYNYNKVAFEIVEESFQSLNKVEQIHPRPVS